MAFRCPRCGAVAVVEEAKYASDRTKLRYNRCSNLNCGFAFQSIEGFSHWVGLNGQEPPPYDPQLPIVYATPDPDLKELRSRQPRLIGFDLAADT
ncbi:Ogr_Delta domain containing protein [Laribacter hongkongensis HLHK9]|uniref:Ogr_Delta domain containing protein n=1 Tax=Laribacter hongkongensis (strain HLHK9) TaxID=557598 RepID=C1DCH8_LARHH|nr:ogr/Delta-like zinc finger family protein [Laribacter hongkongensis]ACO75597.1 Ogr_Delta domain containing protein [Laribacter hongkongensis HLHK9]